jgi:hypothetical protein
MKKITIGLSGLYLSLISCQADKISNSYQSKKAPIPLLLDPFEEKDISFAQISIIDKEKNDTINLQTDNWGRTNYKLDTTKTYYAFVNPGYDPNGKPGDQFKPYITQEFNPNKNLTILKKEAELENLVKK